MTLQMWFGFPQFSHRCRCFCSRAQSTWSHCGHLSWLLKLSQPVTVSLCFFVFHKLDLDTDWVFCGTSFSLGWSDVYLVVRLKLWLLQKNTQRWFAISLCQISGCIISTGLVTDNVNLEHLLKVMSCRCLYWEAALFSSNRLVIRSEWVTKSNSLSRAEN